MIKLVNECSSYHNALLIMGIGSLVFSETQHGVRGTCGAVHNRAGFFDVFLSNYGENGPKMFFFLICCII